MIRLCTEQDLDAIFSIVNDGAQAYKGIIPADRWHEPYMPQEELRQQIEDGVIFWGVEEAGELMGVMGIQPVQDVSLIRHAYVRTTCQRRGVGKLLLDHLLGMAAAPVLIGTWADATWAIGFYEKNGFAKVTHAEKERLLRKYWLIPERQVETSVVLADAKWRACPSSR
jgi:N-acetylglutamate synthase-like GNAT family acetyltransferase